MALSTDIAAAESNLDCACILVQAVAKPSEDRCYQTRKSEAERARHMELKSLMD